MTSSLAALRTVCAARDLGRHLGVLPVVITMIICVFPAQKGFPLTSPLAGLEPGGTVEGARGEDSILHCQSRELQWDAGDGAEGRTDLVPPPECSDWKSTSSWLIH